MATMPELVEVEALEAFTVTRPYGQFHGDPASKRNKICNVPADALDELLRLKKVRVHGKKAVARAAAEKTAKADSAAALPQLDHDGDGKPGGSVSAQGDDIAALRALYFELNGKKAFNGWSEDVLREKIAEIEAAAFPAAADAVRDAIENGVLADGADIPPA